jgi:hypothetical protein
MVSPLKIDERTTKIDRKNREEIGITILEHHIREENKYTSP